jgi:GNAT superfamily N-acetyltransferase
MDLSTALTPVYTFRPARLVDAPVLKELIYASVRGLNGGEYSEAQMEAALGTAFGVDTELIRDGTYFVAEADGRIIACGGWSKRESLYGADGQEGRSSALLDPLHDAARIRAFFVHPEWGRRGIGRALLAHCEQAALANAFVTTELMATLPGHKLYKVEGYVGDERIKLKLPSGIDIELIPMRKSLV